MLEPTTLPRWADQVVADVQEPTEETKDEGYKEGDQPPAPELNWLLLWICTWIKYLDSLELSTTITRFFPKPWLSTNFAFDTGTGFTPNHSMKSSGTGSMTFDLGDHMRDGDSLVAIHVWIAGDATVDMTFTVYQRPADPDATPPAALMQTTETNTPVTPKVHTLTGFSEPDSIFDAENPFFFAIAANAADARVFSIRLDFSRDVSP